MTSPWMPLYIADYLADTKRLTTLEHGAYILLIMDYWRNGGLPTDENRLARIAGLSLEEWRCVSIEIGPFFRKNWRHKRIDEELAKASDRRQKASGAAAKRWKHKAKPNNAKAYAQPGNAKAYAQSMPSQPQPYRKEERENTKKRKALNVAKALPLEILKSTLTAKTAQDVVDHRKALKKPLTSRAAQLLANAFQRTGTPEKAAEAMLLNGWQGFKPEWLEPRSTGRPRSNGLEGYARLVLDDIETETENDRDQDLFDHNPSHKS